MMLQREEVHIFAREAYVECVSVELRMRWLQIAQSSC